MVEPVPILEMAEPNSTEVLIEATGLSMAFDGRQILDPGGPERWIAQSHRISMPPAPARTLGGFRWVST